MARKPDPFWEHTEDRKKCNYCDQIYTSATSVSRVKHHLSGIPGGGIKRCQKVPDYVKEKARAAIAKARARADIDGPPGKKPKPPASSSNNQADNITIPASLPGQNSEAENGIIARPVTSAGDHTSEFSLGGPLAYVQDNVGVLDELYLQSPVNERHGSQNSSPSLSNDVSRNDEGVEPEQIVVGDEGLQHTTGDEARDVFPTPKLEGGAFEENKKVIWSWLMNNEVSLIGIYGMGGVGKTTLMKRIHNRLLDKPDRYRYVYWITVSQDFSVYKLQNLIAKRIGLDLSNEDDEMHRAAKLSKALAGRQNYVLILDDLWNHFEPKEMGITSKMDGCKLILTTRSLDVCLRMGCDVIKVQPLLEEEAWNLFKMELGNYDIKLEHLEKSVADECDGLPLGIRTMARSMRGVYDKREWRNALEELKEARVRLRDMEPEVFRILRYSFLHLNDSKLQQCFVRCEANKIHH